MELARPLVASSWTTPPSNSRKSWGRWHPRTDPLGCKLLFAHELEHPAWGADDDVWALRLKDPLMLSHRHTTVENLSLDVGQIARETLKFVADLIGELACVAEYLCETGANSLEKRST